MSEIEQILGSEDARSKAAAAGAGILVIIAGFLVYNYFSKVGKEGAIQEQAALEDQTGTGFEEIPGAPENGSVAGEATETPASPSVTAPTPSAVWAATNYAQGDIAGGTYTVKRGDTLWEIAEARYGDGFQWKKVLEANKDKVTLLPNGEQARIEIGQVLVLPE